MRNEYDLLKAIAILLVVIGHITNHYPQLGAVTSAIYLFHMPLFIAISGAVYQMGVDRGKYVEFLPFVANKVKRILVPLIFTAVCVLMPTLVLLGKSELGPAETAFNILYGGVQQTFVVFAGMLLVVSRCVGGKSNEDIA